MVRALVAALVVILCARTEVHALHRETPGATRITRDATHTHPWGRSWGGYLPFVSSQDFAQNGNATPQIFMFKLLNYACQLGVPEAGTIPLCPNPPQPFLVQVTARPGSPANPSVTAPPGGGSTVQWLAFDADGTLNGDTSPASGFRQIFLKNLATEELRQLTFGTDGNSTKPSLSSQGGVIVFESTASLGGVPNASGASQIYLYERDSHLLRKLTFGSGPSTQAIPNQNGTLIAFQSTANLLGDGSDTGVSQIFFIVYDKISHNALLRQLTNGNGPSQNAFVSEGGERFIVFDSTATDLIPGSPSTGGSEIYQSVKIPGCVKNGSAPRACDDGTNVGQACSTDLPCVGGSPLPPVRRITTSDRFGDCSFPSLSESSDRVAFICTGDPLDNTTTGNRVFVLDLPTAQLFQLTGTGDVQGPIAMNLGNWFVSMSTTADLAKLGSCGYQLHVIDFYAKGDSAVPNKWVPATEPGQLPPDAAASGGGSSSNLIGKRNFIVAPGTATGGTSAVVTTLAGSTTQPLTGAAAMSLVIGAPGEFTGQASIKVPHGEASFPPIAVPTFGTMCLTASADGSGVIDCDGVHPGGDVLISQDHSIADVNPGCIGGCREGAACQPELHGTHVMPCPVCVGNVCQGGAANGQACSGDANCQAECVDGTLGVCNGPLLGEPSGTFLAGGMQLSIPVNISISKAPGPDGKFCTPDDVRAVTAMPSTLRFTTGTASSAILDADNTAGSNVMTTATGAPFACSALQSGTMAGAALVGALPILHVPEIPTLHDVIVGIRLEPKPDPSACNAPCGASTDCDDGNACNGIETCVNGGCVAGTAVTCDDNDACNGVETCDALTGVCSPGTPCDDGDPCNGVETCDAINGCVPGTAVVCADNDACNGDETCDPTTGNCLPGTALVCDDNNACTDDTCDQATGCVFTNNDANTCDDGNLCTTGDACVAGACGGTATPCDDSDACNGFETCDPSTGSCVNGLAPVCDDNNPCTDDTCDAALGCVYTNNDTNPCDDGTLCTTGDACVSGACVGAVVPCGDTDACNGTEACEASTGNCLPGTPLACDDNNPCTDDACDMALGCVFTPNINPCDDNDACTLGDTCQASACVGTPIVCDDNNPCTGVETCDPLSGCVPGTAVVCDDNNPCTDDTCDATLGCLFSNNTSTCDDGDLCTTGDACVDGLCGGTAIVCTDNDACNGIEACNPTTGACDLTPPENCDDNNPCTDDSCDAALGCVHASNTSACDDGDLCTTGDTCGGGACVGLAVDCADTDLCNGAETCDSLTGSCVPGVAVDCNDNDDCTIDRCDVATGACTHEPDVVCSLTAILTQISTAPAADVGGARRQARLVAKVEKIIAKVSNSEDLPPKRARTVLNIAKKQLVSLGRSVRRSLNHGKISSPLGDDILVLITQVMPDLIALQSE